MTRTLVALVLALVVGGCDDGPLSPGERGALRSAQARWARAGGPDYTVEARVSCFCAAHLGGWARVTVRGDQVVAAVPLQPLPPGVSPSTLGWPTVLGVFDAISTSSDVIRDIAVRFDPGRGYPLYASFGCGPEVADCGVTYEMRNLTIP